MGEEGGEKLGGVNYHIFLELRLSSSVGAFNLKAFVNHAQTVGILGISSLRGNSDK